jgi:hypothetical protein
VETIMNRTITLIREDGTPMQAGLLVELLLNGTVVAQSTIDAGGTVTFEAESNAESNGPFRARVVVPPEALVAREPADGGA